MIILEKFEGDKAVLEVDGITKVVEKSQIHSTVKEGDVLVLQEDIYVKDESETKKRKTELEERFKALWKSSRTTWR